ncbi:hypothetical protein FR271_21985 [Vibrio vulnificus]|nr:hypothetical protein [Vibrio vulnificus]EGR0093622.1 hypothetical protein [Vibrio vulnificus]EIJ0948495.1 hypothetical protein [Vibrio vulnificus]
MEEKKHGGKRAGAGRKKLKTPTRRLNVCEDIYEICKHISDEYQKAPERKKQLIKQYLEAVA